MREEMEGEGERDKDQPLLTRRAEKTPQNWSLPPCLAPVSPAGIRRVDPA